MGREARSCHLPPRGSLKVARTSPPSLAIWAARLSTALGTVPPVSLVASRPRVLAAPAFLDFLGARFFLGVGMVEVCAPEGAGSIGGQARTSQEVIRRMVLAVVALDSYRLKKRRWCVGESSMCPSTTPW